MEVVDALKQVKRLFSNENKWMQGYYAKDENGEDVASHVPEACQWCLEGGLLRVLRDKENTIFEGTIDVLIKNLDKRFIDEASDLCLAPLVFFNDHENTQYGDVINLINRTIANCKE